jgi:hypothetical protein
VDSVTSGDRGRILGCVRSIRISLFLHNLSRRPIHNAIAIARHYCGELAIRYSPKTLHTVCIFGLNVSDNTAIIDNLTQLLQSTAVIVEKRYFSSALSPKRQPLDISPDTDCIDSAPRSCLISVVIAILLLIKEWVAQLAERTNLTLRIYDGCQYELLFSPKRFHCNVPKWFAYFIGKLLPSYDLWILLDVPANLSQSHSHIILHMDTLREREAYRSFVKTRQRYIILDAGKPPSRVAEEAYAAIIDTLALRTERQLRDRI